MGDIANVWRSSSESGDLTGSESVSALEVDEQMPVITALANEWHDDDANDVFQLPDHEQARVPESTSSVEHEDPDLLSLANLWNAEEVDADDVDELGEDSVDELTTPSYACEVPAAISEPALPDVYQVAEGCAEEELPEEWSYGPGHFDFLNEDMFASEDEEMDLENVS
jgi:hypothetical protein